MQKKDDDIKIERIDWHKYKRTMGGQQVERPTEDGLKKNTEGTEQQANELPKDVLTYSYRYDYE